MIESPRTATLITGAAHNLGAEIARVFAGEGQLVITHARSADEAELAASMVRTEGGEALALSFDLASHAEIDAGFDALDAAGVIVNRVVLNAAHLGMTDTATLDLPLAFFDEVLAVNVSGAHRVSMHVARRLVRHELPGAMAMISSLAGGRAIHDRLAYNTSKAAVDGLVRSLAIDLADSRIRVNAIAPGYVWSDRWEGLDEAAAGARRRTIPIGAETAQQEIAELARFLLSDACPTLTGANIVIDGGLSAQQSPRPT